MEAKRSFKFSFKSLLEKDIKYKMTRHYIFFSRDSLPQQGAHIVQIVHLANGAANLGYSSILVYPKIVNYLKPLKLINPFHPQYPSQELIDYYSLQGKLKIVELAIPSLFKKFNNKSKP